VPSLRFSDDDLRAFADASGDRNPLHLETGFARGTPFGERIVHGALLTLAGLGCLPDDELRAVRAVDVAFGGAVLLDETVQVETRHSERAEAWEIQLRGRGRLLTRIVARRGPTATGTAAVGKTSRPMRTEPADAPPADARVDGMYRLGALAEIAPAALHPALAEALAWLSYVVGMEVPGLHGVFAAAKLSLAGDGGSSGLYALDVRDHDPRTDHFTVDGALDTSAGGLVAVSFECFGRPELPVLEPAVADGDASGEAVVVIGGGRGFGAALTLRLLGRGHDAHAVFSTDARALETAAGGAARLHLHRLDARDGDALARLAAAQDLPLRGVVLAAALAPLPATVAPDSAAFIADYVADSVRLAVVPLAALSSLLVDDGFVVFCSSVAVEAPPRDWPHYVAAKSALEGVASWLAAARPELRVIVARLPKMLTGMTNTPTMRLDAASPDAVAAQLVAELENVPAGLTTLELRA
jgi:NAD(P)-dependent dehydrogenase (short-subunit alcohol dehydrogenase family)/acyl dehydratase